MQPQGSQGPPEWVANYIGIPFYLGGRDLNGSDCWGLVRLVMLKQFNIPLASYDTTAYEELDPAECWTTLGHLIVAEKNEHPETWRPVMLQQVCPGDLLLIRMRGYSVHVAIVVSDGWMLHTEEGVDAICEQFRGSRWQHRILGAYRHVRLCS